MRSGFAGELVSRVGLALEWLEGIVDRWRDGILRRWLLRMPGLSGWKLRRLHTRRYYAKFKRWPNLRRPRLFTEYITLRVITDRNPLLKVANDKIAVRDLINRILGPGYTVPLLTVWSRTEQIEWTSLPLPFVVKPNHMSGPHRIVQRLSSADLADMSVEATAWLKQDYFDRSFEWGYRNLPRRIIAEPLLRAADGGTLIEVDVFTFHGQPRVLLAMTGGKRSRQRCAAWFDHEGKRLDLRGVTPLAEEILEPAAVERITSQIHTCRPELLDVSRRIGAHFPFIRVDFYLANEGLKIGELTTYPAGGRGIYEPAGWDSRLGEMLRETAPRWEGRNRRKPGDWPPLA